jgi:hypothetical protein
VEAFSSLSNSPIGRIVLFKSDFHGRLNRQRQPSQLIP